MSAALLSLYFAAVGASPAAGRPPSSPSGSPDAADIHDIAGPIVIPNYWIWALWAAAGLIAVALGAWALAAWMRRKPAGESQRILGPHERARIRLEEALRIIDQPKPFCIEVSSALREYLEERFQLRAPERTTEEFLEELAGSPVLLPDQKTALSEFLQACDLVKFARHEPQIVELEEIQKTALRLVSQTEPSLILESNPVATAA